MAKGLRSQAKLAHRNAKRRDEKSDYRVIEAARISAIQSRLAAGLAAPKMQVYSVADIQAAEDAQEQQNRDQDMYDQDQDQETEQQATTKKISTSGPRDNARSRWKKTKTKRGKHTKKDSSGGKR